MKITSKQAIYLGADRKSVFPENHPEAAFLLVGKGCEIEEKVLEQYDGADKLVNQEAKPYITVTDSKVVGGKVVGGEKVKIEPSVAGAPNAEASTEAPAASAEKATRGKRTPSKK